VLNAILWRDRKGDVPLPAPKHGSLVQAAHDND